MDKSKKKTYKILFLSHSANAGNDDLFLGSKIKTELSKYFDTLNVNYFEKDYFRSKPKSINIALKYKNTGIINKLLNLAFIYKTNFKLIKTKQYDLIWLGVTSSFINYFIFIYPLLIKKQKYFVQTFTPSVKPSRIRRYLADLFLALNFRFFQHIGVGLERNIKAYRLKEKQAVMINIGVHDYGFYERDYTKVKLLYLGTLNNREVWKSVEALGLYLQKNNEIPVEYNIIGAGYESEVKKLKSVIANYKLESIVRYHGYLPTEKVREFFQYSNVGVAYVPVNEYFQNSSSKTLEYLISGMPVIATNNSFRGKIINGKCGVLTQDNTESFAQGLKKLIDNINNYNTQEIRNMFKEYTMENSFKNSYVPKLVNIIENRN
ncbi:MAG: glycosyltransferase [Candidatus Woesearchaeota archaeon]